MLLIYLYVNTIGIIFFEVYCLGVNWLKFIPRCHWVIFFGIFSIYFWIIICCFLFLLFIQSASLWILIFPIKVSNFLVDILKLQGKEFLKINKLINKTSVITIAPPDINVFINTRIYNIRCTVDICVLVYLMFQSADFFNIFGWLSVCF